MYVWQKHPVLLLWVGLCLVGTVPALCAEVPFTERVISTTADGATSVFAIDLDGDGNTDVISASNFDNKIAWYESDGESPPGFTEHEISGNASRAQSVFAIDMDGDGDIDVLSASRVDDKIAWYENNGDSPLTFTEHEISITADGARSVFAADLDGDGDIDVLSASENDDKIAWYENNGDPDPGFTEHVISTTADGAQSVFAADVDGDGNIDVLSVSALDGKLAWYENDGDPDPDFSEQVITTTLTRPHSVFAVDLDGDGDTDVLAVSFDDDKILWYENDGASPPGFTEHVISNNVDGPFSVFATDLNCDGNIDVLSASRNDNKIAVYINDGGSPPSFTECVISTTAMDARSVYATDMDCDGDIDVLSASFDDDKIAWYENGKIPEAPILAPPPHAIRKNRYISIDPRGAAECIACTHHIRVTLDSTEVLGVDEGQVGSVWWANDPCPQCISIVGPTQPESEPDWSACPTVHLTGCAIIPTSTYSIVTVNAAGDVSDPLLAETQLRPADDKWWGDCVGFFDVLLPGWTPPQGVTNFDDVTAALKTWQDPNAINATHTSVSDIHPNRPDLGGLSVHPNKLVNIDDVFNFINAFAGEEYPGGDLASCTDP